VGIILRLLGIAIQKTIEQAGVVNEVDALGHQDHSQSDANDHEPPGVMGGAPLSKVLQRSHNKQFYYEVSNCYAFTLAF
jgi:hypothetical protein